MLPRSFVLSLATLALLAAPVTLTTAVAMQNGLKDASAALPPPSVLAMNQKVEDKTVTVAYVQLPADGYVAIYGSDADGKRTGEALGYVPLAKGDHRNIPVELANAPKSGTSLWASLYTDVDGDKKLDVKKDTPFWNELPQENRFEVNG